jgi:NAD(P)-dependent dehydrogenase (short-subunit alcohol dehydrogenase family)
MEQIKEQYETNVFGVFAVSKAFIPHFRHNKDGMFINIASSSAQFNYPFIGAYGSSKWAVRGLTEALGIELAPFNIEVKAIYPGAHATKIFTKLDDGTGGYNMAFQAYKPFFTNFFSAQSSVSEVTSPANIANEIWRAANNRKGKLHIVSGGDAKLFAFVKKVMTQRAFQKLQIRSIKQEASKGEISFARWLMGKNTGKLEVIMPKI